MIELIGEMMTSYTILSCLILLIIICYFTLIKPIYLEQRKTYFDKNQDKQEVFNEDIAELEIISELKKDFEMGKITKEEFQPELEYHQARYIKLNKNK